MSTPPRFSKEDIEKRKAIILAVDLPSFMEAKLGYSVKIDKDNRYYNGEKRWVADGNAGHVKLIRPNQNKYPGIAWCYLDEKTEKGSNVVDLLCRHHGYGSPSEPATWNRIYDEIAAFSNARTPIYTGNENVANKPSGSIISSDFSVQRPSINDNQYLNSRGISIDLLGSDKYRGAVFNKLYFAQPDSVKPIPVIPTVFPVRTIDGTVLGFQRVFKKSNGSTGKIFDENMKKSQGVWASSNLKKNVPLIVAENPIDTISYTVLHDGLIDRSNDLAFLGNLDKDGVQLGVIQQFVDKLQPSQIILANDNDGAGWKNDFKFLCHIRKPFYENPFNLLDIEHSNIHNYNNSSTGYAKITVDISKSCPDFQKNNAAELIGRFYHSFSKLSLPETSKIDFANNKLELTFFIDMGINSKLAKCFVNDIYSDQGFFKIDHASRLHKDWNAQLMSEKGLSRDSLVLNDNSTYFGLAQNIAQSNWANSSRTFTLGAEKKNTKTASNALEQDC
jgi:hypothetical protein